MALGLDFGLYCRLRKKNLKYIYGLYRSYLWIY